MSENVSYSNTQEMLMVLNQVNGKESTINRALGGSTYPG